jgi:hypothetical protein
MPWGAPPSHLKRGNNSIDNSKENSYSQKTYKYGRVLPLPKNMPLTLIGSIHSDYDEAPRLAKVLDEIKPDVVFVEGDEAGHAIYLEVHAEVRRIIHGSNVTSKFRAWFDIGQENSKFELRESILYSQRSGAEFQYLGDETYNMRQRREDIIREEIAGTIRGLMRIVNEGKAGMKRIKDEHIYRVKTLREDIREALRDPTFEFTRMPTRGDVKGVRDRVMAKTVQKRLSSHPLEHIAVVAGVGHVLGNQERASLYSLMMEQTTKRVFLPLPTK